MNSLLELVRKELLQEAKQSPNLLSDLAGLESYISESYFNRSFIELLQNADDAKASKFKITKSGSFLFISNNGNIFTRTDLEGLCRSASSSKVRGKNIGYRGIGFKSVVGMAEEIMLFSGDLEVYFSRKETFIVVPEAKKVPLIRIPHMIPDDIKAIVAPQVLKLKQEGFITTFVFTNVIAGNIEMEFEALDVKSMLFLNNIGQIEIETDSTSSITATRTKINSEEFFLTLYTEDAKQDWRLISKDGVSLSFLVKENGVQRVPEGEAITYAFLPTEDRTGLGILLNGDYSTDPSRRHVIPDEHSQQTIKTTARIIVDLIKDGLGKKRKDANKILEALLPYSDPRLNTLKRKTFDSFLIEAIKEQFQPYCSGFTLSPDWLSPVEFNKLFLDDNNVIGSELYQLDGFVSFLKYLGIKEAKVESIASQINKSNITILGAAQIATHIFTQMLTNRSFLQSIIVDLKIFFAHGERVSINEISEQKLVLDETYVSLLQEKGLSLSDLSKFLKPFININHQFVTQVFEQQKSRTTTSSAENDKQQNTSGWLQPNDSSEGQKVKIAMSRWRSAEEITREILNEQGFNLRDVSKFNVGYDLEGTDPNGNIIHIEVKSIRLPGEKFKLTNNEKAIAHEKGVQYLVAIVRQVDNVFEIALISDPVKSLVLNRQCTQWVWECSEYEYNPTTFKI